ncbi:hypothetical protein OS188_11545 [Xanthomarina sp. F1114]|uniref:hypothetical protein n=1 Tax=Xanthomarina sp. F1114 TaxID=2996019 RepID=UPI00225E2A77|nr:hypothetical protein [Xanthomarina sp. F1114]MCX7548584.1 hypothetical protein [Xanthomarina sp. F1114]
MNFLNQYRHDFKENYILYIPLTIILQSCLGSVAAMLILMNSTSGTFHFFELTLCVVFAMGYNAVVYAQLKNKVIFNILIATLLVHISLIIINLIRFI